MNKVANHIFRQATFQIIEASLIKFGLRKYILKHGTFIFSEWAFIEIAL